MSGTILALIATPSLTRMRFNVYVVIKQIYCHLSAGKHRIAYRIFQSYPSIPLEHVPGLAEVIISKKDLHQDTALHYRHRRQRWLKFFRHDADFLTRIRTNQLNNMALAYAKAPHLTPRMAWRQVHYCYRALRRDRLPLTADMTKALTYAGVIRYLEAEAWMSTVRFQWVLGHVREVEGADVADRLDRLVWEWRGRVIEKRRARARAVARRGSSSDDEGGGRGGAPTTAFESARTRRAGRVTFVVSGGRPSFRWGKAHGE